MKVLIVACSLHRSSRSFVLAKHAQSILAAAGVEVTFLDLRELELPLCDGGCNDAYPNVAVVKRAVHEAEVVLLGVPIYNYDVNAAAKNFVELAGKSWVGEPGEKVVGFLCAAGGKGSYMSVMGIANSLMLDFRCLIIPRFVYATSGDFADDRIESAVVEERVAELCDTAIRLGATMSGTPDRVQGHKARSCIQ